MRQDGKTQDPQTIREKEAWTDMGVSKNSGTPKSSILIGFSIINHPFWGTPIFGKTHIDSTEFKDREQIQAKSSSIWTSAWEVCARRNAKRKIMAYGFGR